MSQNTESQNTENSNRGKGEPNMTPKSSDTKHARQERSKRKAQISRKKRIRDAETQTGNKLSKKDLAKIGGVVVGATLTGVGLIAAAPLALTAAGFTAGGVAAGSVASAVQSVVYGGATGGLFSIFQSAGAAGIGTAATVGLGATGAAAGGKAGGGIAAGLTKDEAEKEQSMVWEIREVEVDEDREVVETQSIGTQTD